MAGLTTVLERSGRVHILSWNAYRISQLANSGLQCALCLTPWSKDSSTTGHNFLVFKKFLPCLSLRLACEFYVVRGHQLYPGT